MNPLRRSPPEPSSSIYELKAGICPGCRGEGAARKPSSGPLTRTIGQAKKESPAGAGQVKLSGISKPKPQPGSPGGALGNKGRSPAEGTGQ
jgi:hypothetical protein